MGTPRKHRIAPDHSRSFSSRRIGKRRIRFAEESCSAWKQIRWPKTGDYAYRCPRQDLHNTKGAHLALGFQKHWSKKFQSANKKNLGCTPFQHYERGDIISSIKLLDTWWSLERTMHNWALQYRCDSVSGLPDDACVPDHFAELHEWADATNLW